MACPWVIARQPPPPVVYEDMLQGNIKLILAGVAVAQLLGLVWAVRTLQRWHRLSPSRPGQWLRMMQELGLPLLVQLSLAAAVLVLLPRPFERPY